MREQLVSRLLEAEEFVSGARLCLDLGVSRSAVWKHVEALRREGFSIKASPRKGYRLVSIPDLLHPGIVLPLLEGVFGRPYHYYRTLRSTNDTAKELAHSGSPEGTVVVAEEQTAGRGRRGRSWYSPPGGLWFSLVLRPPVPPAEVNSLPLLLSLAVARGIEASIKILPGLKWPNDLLLEGRKIGGILTETSAEAEQVHYAVAGIGLNVNIASFAPDIEKTATSLKTYTGSEICRARLLSKILIAIENLYRRWCREGFEPFRAMYKDRLYGLGKQVAAISSGQILSGVASDVDADGRLLLTLPGGSQVRLSVGEITLREESQT